MKYFRSLKVIQGFCLGITIILVLGIFTLLIDEELDAETFWGLVITLFLLFSVNYLAGLLRKFMKFTLEKIDPEKLKTSEDKDKF